MQNTTSNKTANTEVSRTEVKLTQLPEVYHGEATGKYVFHCETVLPGPMSAVLGRGYTREEATNDFVRRAKEDGHNPDVFVNVNPSGRAGNSQWGWH